jgi:ferredoxin-thioredoxin reductase catalytic subunit
MKGFKLNTDLEYVTGIIKGISKKDGHCPCRLNTDESTLCPCDEFITDGDCKCNLFIKEDD